MFVHLGGITMKITSKVTSDQKQITSLIRRLQSLESHEIQYGYFQGDIHQSSGLDIAELAELLNFGTDNILPRPFMAAANDSAERYSQTSNEWKRHIWSYLCGGGNISQVLGKIGLAYNRFIPQAILFGDWPRNSDEWAAWKFEKYGSSQPLIETSELMDSSKVKVIKTGDKK